jgi:glutaredoxin 3
LIGEAIMTEKIRIYGTDTCPFCRQAIEAYGERAIFIDVTENRDNLEEMLALSGGNRQIPVIVEGDEVKVGYLGEASLRGGIPLFGGT